MNATKFVPKNPQIFSCFICDYNTCNSKDYKKHCRTVKHKRLTNTTNLSHLSPDQKYSKSVCICMCGNTYKHMPSLYKHKKTCNYIKTTEYEMCKKFKEDDEGIKYQENLDKLTTVVLDVVSKNNELTKQIMELSLKPHMNICNNNNTFNLHFFLNERCKNALNIREFVESIQVQLQDLENTGRIGYVEGISKIFINNLEQLDTHERPIHCSDSKRETLYIKNDNKWNKDDDKKSGLTRAIKEVANKNIMQISEWQKKNPDYNDPESKKNDKYMKIVLNSMSGSTQEEQSTNINKIIKNVAKEVVIEKQ